MKLNKIEKIIVVIIVIGLVLRVNIDEGTVPGLVILFPDDQLQPVVIQHHGAEG